MQFNWEKSGQFYKAVSGNIFGYIWEDSDDWGWHVKLSLKTRKFDICLCDYPRLESKEVAVSIAQEFMDALGESYV